LDAHLHVTYIFLGELLPQGLAIAASAAYLIAISGAAPKEVLTRPLRVRVLASAGLLSCILSGIGTLEQVMATYLIVAEPFELVAAALFVFLIFRPDLDSRPKLRIYLAITVAISGLYAGFFMSNTLLWLARGAR
jgi:hypothetical protein